MLEISQIISYSTALGIAAAVPGPGMTAIVARSINQGPIIGFIMLSGLILGDIIYLFFAISGLAIIAQHYNHIFIVINWAAALYLCWLAFKFWRFQPNMIKIKKNISKQEVIATWFSGLTITLGNPKTIGFYLAILPLVITVENVSLSVMGKVLIPITIIILFLVGAIFILGAVKASHFFENRRSQQILYRVVAIIMFIVAFVMVIN